MCAVTVGWGLPVCLANARTVHALMHSHAGHARPSNALGPLLPTPGCPCCHSLCLQASASAFARSASPSHLGAKTVLFILEYSSNSLSLTTPCLRAVWLAGIRLCFREASIPLPPWREGRAMLSKWITELHTDEPLPIVPLPDAALRRLLAPYHTPFRTAVRQASAPAAGAGAGSLGKGQQQQKQQHGQDSGQGSNPAALPPLPPGTGAGAAAAAPKQAQQQHADDSGHCANHHWVPDVPRKIIVGFPVASPPPAALQQQLAHGLDQDVALPAPSQQQQRQLAQAQAQQRAVGSAGQQQPQVQCSSNRGEAKQLEGVSAQQQQQQRAAAGTYAAAPAGPADDAAAVSRSGHALTQVDPSARQNSSASNQPAASAGKAGNSRALSPAAAAVARPAFASTAGVVVATAGGTSPGIVVNKQWVQHITEGVIAGTSAEKGKGLNTATTAAVAAPGAVVADSSGNNEPSAAAAAATAAAVRQYKTLDQLLPRMRTVKLGAG